MEHQTISHDQKYTKEIRLFLVFLSSIFLMKKEVKATQ